MKKMLKVVECLANSKLFGLAVCVCLCDLLQSLVKVEFCKNGNSDK